VSTRSGLAEVRDGGGGMATTGSGLLVGGKMGDKIILKTEIILSKNKIKLLGHIKGHSVRAFVL